MLLLFAKKTRHAGRCHRMKKDLEFHLMVQSDWNPVSTKDKSRHHQFGTKMLAGIFIGYAKFWRRFDWRLDHRRVARYKNNVASEVHIKRFKSNGVGIKAFILPCAGGSQGQEGRELRRGKSILYFERGKCDPCRAQGMTLCKNKVELQTFLNLIAKLWKHISGVCRENLFVTTISSLEMFVCTERVIIPNPVEIHRRREANKNQLGHFGREQYR